MPRSICVFCGAREGADPDYLRSATEIGTTIAKMGWRLVYGAGDVGLMGAVAEAAQIGGGETFGVIPTHLISREGGKTDLTRFVVTENMHERKKVMFMNSGAILVLPGGAGSLDEFFEVFTWAQLNLHRKPIVLLNIQDYWTPLVHLIDHIIDQGFADPSLRDLITVVADTETAIEALAATA